MRYELTEHEWTAIRPMLPNKPRGVTRVNDGTKFDFSSGAFTTGQMVPHYDELMRRPV